jgi:hypothetical protein
MAEVIEDTVPQRMDMCSARGVEENDGETNFFTYREMSSIA